MSDQPSHNNLTKFPQSQPQSSASDAKVLASPANAATPPSETVPITLLESPSAQQIADLMVAMAQIASKQVGMLMAKGAYSASNPACQGLIAAGAALEQGVMGFVQWLQQMEQKRQQQSGMVMPGQGDGRSASQHHQQPPLKPFSKN